MLCISLNTWVCPLFSNFMQVKKGHPTAKSLRCYSNSSPSEIQVCDNLLSAAYEKVTFACCIILDDIYVLFYNYQGINNKNGKKLLMFLPEKTIFPSFPKVSWALSALQNDEWTPCSLLLLKSFLFMPVIQGLCFDCSWEMKTLSCWWINTATFKICVCKMSLKPLWNVLQKH